MTLYVTHALSGDHAGYSVGTRVCVLAGDNPVLCMPYAPVTTEGWACHIDVPRSMLRPLQPDERWITLAAASIENAREAAEASASGLIELHPENSGLCRLTSNQ
jgi:hypothetical protein